MSSSSQARRSWFRYWINGRLSQWAHSLAVEWTCREDGTGVAACGADPYAIAPDPLAVGFTPAPDDFPKCSKCVEALADRMAA